jgi:hypothetical protein
MNYIIYNNEGQILRTVTCPKDQVSAQIKVGESVMEGRANDDKHYIDITTKSIVDIPIAPSDAHTFDYSTKTWVLSTSEAIKFTWNRAKKYRELKLAGGFSWGTYTFDSDPNSQQLIQGATIAAQIAVTANLPFSKTWTLADNTTLVVNSNDMFLIAKALGDFIEKCYIAGQQFRNTIELATNTDEILALDYLTIFNKL